MNVFITGGTGLIGSAVVAELLAHGHGVVGLARSAAAAGALEIAGARPLAGKLGDATVLREGVSQADGVIHLAFGHDFSTADALSRAVSEENAALRTIGDELVGSNRPFVTVSGTPWIPGQKSVETDPLPLEGPVGGRAVSVNAVLALAARGVRSSAVRMPRTVHNQGKGGFAGLLTDIARKTGVSGIPGDGRQRWPAVHALDAAVLFRLALESAPAGTVWHAVADDGDQVVDIASVIGKRLGLSTERLPEDHFGPLAPIFIMDQPASSAYTRRTMHWQPSRPSLLRDLENIQP